MSTPSPGKQNGPGPPSPKTCSTAARRLKKPFISPSFVLPSNLQFLHGIQAHSGNSRQVEQVHRSAARFDMVNYGRTSNVTSLLDPFGWTSLQERHQARLQMMCKTRYNLVDIPWSSYLTPLSTSTRGYSSRFTIPHTRISKYASSYFPRTIRDWNQLPVDPAAYPSLNAFKSALRDLTK